jgi:hypothetical protein
MARVSIAAASKFIALPESEFEKVERSQRALRAEDRAELARLYGVSVRVMLDACSVMDVGVPAWSEAVIAMHDEFEKECMASAKTFVPQSGRRVAFEPVAETARRVVVASFASKMTTATARSLKITRASGRASVCRCHGEDALPEHRCDDVCGAPLFRYRAVQARCVLGQLPFERA